MRFFSQFFLVWILASKGFHCGCLTFLYHQFVETRIFSISYISSYTSWKVCSSLSLWKNHPETFCFSSISPVYFTTSTILHNMHTYQLTPPCCCATVAINKPPKSAIATFNTAVHMYVHSLVTQGPESSAVASFNCLDTGPRHFPCKKAGANDPGNMESCIIH